jgi:dihydrofolate synthase/folylpolyglutamate synthase
MSNYSEACNYISEIPRFAAKTELANTRILLGALGNPQEKYKSLHVAGTNGKGSVCRMLSLMLQKAGYKTGLFISPHLIRMNERISINGTDISDADFLREFEIIRDTSNVLLKKNPDNKQPVKDAGNALAQDATGSADVVSVTSVEVDSFAHPAYFEFLFAMAADYFARQGCDFVVWETGLGGRLDATNTVTPEVSVITSIGMDHMQYLGNTIKEIAGEKAGIIKPGIPVIYNTGSEEADQVISAKAQELGSRAVRVPDAAAEFPEDICDIIDDFATSTPAAYQCDNAETAVAAFLELSGSKQAYTENISISADQLSAGQQDADLKTRRELQTIISASLGAFSWPGRMQFIDEGVVIDGAHNEDAAKRFTESINILLQNGQWKKVSLLFAVSSDKDYEDIIRILCESLPLEDVYVTEINSDRRTDPAGIVELFQKYRPAGEYWNNYGSHDLKKTLDRAGSERSADTLLAAVGSLYMVGEILNLIGNPDA